MLALYDFLHQPAYAFAHFAFAVVAQEQDEGVGVMAGAELVLPEAGSQNAVDEAEKFVRLIHAVLVVDEFELVGVQGDEGVAALAVRKYPAHLLEEASGIVAAGQLVGQLYAPYFLLVEALEYGNVRKEHDGCDERGDVHEKVEPAQAGKAGHEQVFRGRIEQGDA